MEKRLPKTREKRQRLEDLIRDEALRGEMMSRLYKGDPLFGEKTGATVLPQNPYAAQQGSCMS